MIPTGTIAHHLVAVLALMGKTPGAVEVVTMAENRPVPTFHLFACRDQETLPSTRRLAVRGVVVEAEEVTDTQVVSLDLPKPKWLRRSRCRNGPLL